MRPVRGAYFRWGEEQDLMTGNVCFVRAFLFRCAEAPRIVPGGAGASCIGRRPWKPPQGHLDEAVRRPAWRDRTGDGIRQGRGMGRHEIGGNGSGAPPHEIRKQGASRAAVKIGLPCRDRRRVRDCKAGGPLPVTPCRRPRRSRQNRAESPTTARGYNL